MLAALVEWMPDVSGVHFLKGDKYMVLKKKHLKILIYMVVAYSVGLAVILYDFSVSYAASFDSDIEPDVSFHYFRSGVNNDQKKAHRISDYHTDYDDHFADFKFHDSDSLGNKYKYNEHFLYFNDDSYSSGGHNVTSYSLYSDTEMVVVAQTVLSLDDASFVQYTSTSYNCNSMLSFCIMSKSVIDGYYCPDWYDKNWVYDSTNYGHRFYCISSSFDSDSYYLVSALTYGDNKIFGMNAGSMKVFSDFSSARNYLKTGDLSGLLWHGAPTQYDGDNIYLNDFQMIVHDSNAYSAYYLEFKYTIPEQLRDAVSLQLDIAEEYNMNIKYFKAAEQPISLEGSNTVNLLNYPTGFKLYLDDIDVLGQISSDKFYKRAVLGSIGNDLGSLDFSIGGNNYSLNRGSASVTFSKLFLNCVVIADNKSGVSYSGSVDFISGSNDMSSYTPDASGNYKYNDDFKNQGHYYTDVSTDAAGNVTYNYYYYGDDNSKTEISAKDSADNTLTVVPVPGQNGSIINNITMPDHIFVNVSGSSGGPSGGSNSDVGNVTIEDDDLSFNSLRDSIKDGYGLIDDTDTGAKGDGLIAMLSDLFGYLPAKFVGLIMLGTSSVVGIAVLRMIFKR